MVNNQIEENRGHETSTTLQNTCTMNNPQSNSKPTTRVLSNQNSSAPALQSAQTAEMNSAPPATSRDPTPQTVARKRGHPKQPRIEQTHKSSSRPRPLNQNDTDDSSTSNSGGDRPHKLPPKNDRHEQRLMNARSSSIVRSSTAGATKSMPTPSSNPFQKEILLPSSRDMIAPTAAPTNMLHRASQPLSSGSRIAPTTPPRGREIFDAREAIKQIVRVKSSAGISNPQDDTPRMTAAKKRAQEEELVVSRSQAKSSDLAYLASLESAFRDAAFYTPGRDSLYEKQPIQSAPRPQSLYDPHRVQSAFPQPSAFKQAQHDDELKRWQQSLWKDDGMM